MWTTPIIDVLLMDHWGFQDVTNTWAHISCYWNIPERDLTDQTESVHMVHLKSVVWIAVCKLGGAWRTKKAESDEVRLCRYHPPRKTGCREQPSLESSEGWLYHPTLCSLCPDFLIDGTFRRGGVAMPTQGWTWGFRFLSRFCWTEWGVSVVGKDADCVVLI